MPDLSRAESYKSQPGGAARLGGLRPAETGRVKAGFLKSGRRAWLTLAPETRLGLTVIASVAALAMSNLISVGLILAASALYLLAQVKLKAAAMVYLFFSLMMATALACLWGLAFVFPTLRDAPIESVIVPFFRLAISINMIAPLALYAELSGLITTMNRLRLPGLIKLPLLVTIRFIPTFINDLKQLREAVRIRFRGRSGPLFWGRRPFLWWRVFFLPLVVRLIRSADELAVAAELKGLSAETDFGSAPLTFSRTDRIIIGLGCAIIILAAGQEVLYVTM
ncbi:hypothetical protein C4J81_01925 [Deltaproteobacteria bacterium Smac51]|nr:hypothetical protein C4J81_01925 [Deltaproteobacteria bacterium Smac51]